MSYDEHEAAGMRLTIPDYWPDVTGIGSVTTVEMSDEDKQHAYHRERNKHPIGFAQREEVQR